MTTHIVTLAFSKPQIAAASWGSLFATIDPRAVGTAVIVDNHYPMHRENWAALLSMMRTPGWWFERTDVLDPGKNLGLAGGYNLAFKHLESVWKPEDLVILCDCDEFMPRFGWADAAARVFAADPTCGWLSLSSAAAEENSHKIGCVEKQLGGERVLIPNNASICHAAVVRVSCLQAIQGITDGRPYYGYSEVVLYPKIKAAGFWQGYLADWRLERSMSNHAADVEYTAYKLRHVDDIGSGREFLGSFEEYLAAKGITS